MLIAIDVETTGLIYHDSDDPIFQPEIIEFGACSESAEFVQLIKPAKEISPEITKITSINNDDVADAPSFLAAFPAISKFMTGAETLITFNGPGYDLPVIMFNLRRYGLQYQFPWPRKHVDLMTAAAEYLGMQGKTGNKPPKLTELHLALFDKEHNAHRALDDARATMKCYLELQKRGVL